ncbi:TPA: hypothetical protein DCX16_03935 [bacterium]|nr:hypothetical protein [bacterium]
MARRKNFVSHGIKVFFALILAIFIINRIVGTKAISKQEEYEKKLKGDPRDVNAILSLADTYYKKAIHIDSEESIPFLEGTIALCENAQELEESTRTLFLLGKAYFEMAKYTEDKNDLYDKAQKSFLSCIKKGLNSEELFILLGHTWLIRGYLNEAIDAYNNALSINPNNPFIISNIAFSYKEKGELDKALSILKKIEEPIDKNLYIMIHLLFGEIYERKGLFLLAKKEYISVLKKDKRNKKAKAAMKRLS